LLRLIPEFSRFLIFLLADSFFFISIQVR